MPLVSKQLIAVLVWSVLFSAKGAPLSIDGDPLSIQVDTQGVISVYHSAVPQYYGASSKGSILTVNDEVFQRAANGAGTFALWEDEGEIWIPVSQTQPDPQTIVTTLSGLQEAVQLRQTIRYTSGRQYYDLEWQFTNTGETALEGAWFGHGGDVSPQGSDRGIGSWDGNQVAALLTNGIFGMALAGITAPDQYLEGPFDLVREAMKAGGLPNTVQTNLHDSAYALGWNLPMLLPGSSMVIQARELWAGLEYVDVFVDVTTNLPTPMLAWTLNRQTGLWDGTLSFQPLETELRPPYWLVLDSSERLRFGQPDGTNTLGRETIDITHSVTNQVGDVMQTGETAVVNGFSVFTFNRDIPPESAFALYATLRVLEE